LVQPFGESWVNYVQAGLLKGRWGGAALPAVRGASGPDRPATAGMCLGVRLVALYKVARTSSWCVRGAPVLYGADSVNTTRTTADRRRPGPTRSL